MIVSLPGGLSNREDNNGGAPRANEGGRSTGSATIKRSTLRHHGTKVKGC